MSAENSMPIVQTPSLTLDEVWQRRDDLIRRGFAMSQPTLIEALPVSGKSYGVIEWAAETGNPLTVFAPRHNLLDEYEKRCERFGLTPYRLPSFYRDCESFDENGAPIDSIAREMERDYKRGIKAITIHGDHPNSICQKEGECGYLSRRDFDPGDYDVLLGTYRHAHVEDWIFDRYVAFDEFPGDAFLETFDGNLPSVVSTYLGATDSLPFRNYEELNRLGQLETKKQQVNEWRRNLYSSLTDERYARENTLADAHAMAPMATLAVHQMKPLSNNWWHSDLGRGRVGVLSPRSQEWTFILPPDLSEAKSVIGLDGTPNPRLWEVSLNEEVRTLSLLRDDEREIYLKDVLGYEFIQTTEAWKAIQGGDGASPPKDLALIEGISNRENGEPILISSKKAIEQYEKDGLTEITDTYTHYGNLKGLNEFGRERLGVVIGCPQPSDDEIEKWCALAGESVSRKEVDGEQLRGNETDFGVVGNEVLRTFVHDEVLQAAMRLGREEVDSVRGATVYLHTSAIPEWLPVEKLNTDIHAWLTKKNGMRDVIEAIQSLDEWRVREWKATELYSLTNVGKRHVRNCLARLCEQGYIENCGKKGQGGAIHYANRCLDKSGEFGHVEFSGTR